MRSFIRLFFLLLPFLTIVTGKTQCPGNGQNPPSAFPVCGTKPFSPGSVTLCAGQKIPVPVCTSATLYTDINPYYYKFTCYVAGPLEFTITPNNLGDDYDWQLFDITGRNPNDIFTDASLFVACNWSGNTGITGTSTTATTANGCDGNYPLITQAPNLIVGHLYLLMVSHFTNTQSGYTLTFTNASAAAVTDPTSLPKIDTVYTACGAGEIKVKINKKIKCSTVAANGSDFDISTNPAIASVISVGCSTGFDTDSIILKLAAPLPNGSYTVNIKNGTDGNTLLDICDGAAVPGGSLKNIQMYLKPTATIITQIINETCKADTIQYSHSGTNATNWQWTFDGNPATSNLQTVKVAYNSFATRVVKLVVSNPLCIDSSTQNIPIANRLLIPKFGASRDTTCPNNPETFTDSSQGTITSWKWDFANGQTSNVQAPPAQTYPILPTNNLYPTKLIVTNSLGCIDSMTKNIFVRGTIPTDFDSIIPPACAGTEVKIYFKQAMVCSSITPTGSEFSISGPAANSIIGATINCINGVGTTVTLQLANPLTTGTYQISLSNGSDGNTIVNDCGIATLPKSVSFQASGHINTAFNYTSKLGCFADTLTYHHIPNNNVNNWQWSFDGVPATSTSQNPVVVYTNFTKRDVQIIVGNGICFDTSAVIAVPIVDHSLQAKFAMPDTTCGLANTPFTDSSKGILTNWYWSFGDGQKSNAQNPTHNYPLAYVFTQYPVQLIVKNITNCYDTTVAKNITVRPSSPALMNTVSAALCGPDSIVLTFNAPMLCNTVATNGSDFSITGPSSPPIASAYIPNCTNGVGRTVVIKLVTPLITNGGTFNLNLKKGTDGNTILNECGIETAPALISFIAYPKANAAFTYTVTHNCVQDTLFLNHAAANNENKWNWYINGGWVGNTPSYILPYTSSGDRNIKLITANPLCADTTIQVIPLLFDKVKAKIASSNTIVCPDETIIFSDISTGNITNRFWNFGNGQTSTSSTPPPQTYILIPVTPISGSSATTFTVKLMVNNNIPCYDSAFQTITVPEACLVQVASAFAPDGINKYLYPLNAFKAISMTFRVFNRLGNLVFESHDMQNKWDGTYKGEKQPAATYIWMLDYTDKDTGQRYSLKGTSVLIR